MKLLDMHCDTMLRIFQSEGKENLQKNNLHVDEKKMLNGDVLAQFFAMYVDIKEYRDPYKTCVQMLEGFEQQLKNCTKIKKACSYNEILENERQGFMSAIIAIEEGAVLEGSMEKLYSLFEKGVRAITLTWNYPNEIGFPNHLLKYKDKGLTTFGKNAVGEMELLGIIPDASHLSDAGFYDLIDICKKPFFATHSNCRAICDHPRNLSDDMIKKLAEKGGVSGLTYESFFLVKQSKRLEELAKSWSTVASQENSLLEAEISKETQVGTIEDIVKHGLHMLNIGGADFPAIGGDLDGTMNVAGFKNIGETIQLADAFHDAGLSWDKVEKIMYKNAMRVIRDTMI